MGKKESMRFRHGVMYNDSGKKILNIENGNLKIQMPVKVKHNIRYGMGNDYKEKGYYCPKCGWPIAYYNGVVWESGIYGQKFCHECGYKLDWNVDEREVQRTIRIRTEGGML